MSAPKMETFDSPWSAVGIPLFVLMVIATGWYMTSI